MGSRSLISHAFNLYRSSFGAELFLAELSSFMCSTIEFNSSPPPLKHSLLPEFLVGY